MRKFLSVFTMAAVAALVFTACGKKNENSVQSAYDCDQTQCFLAEGVCAPRANNQFGFQQGGFGQFPQQQGFPQQGFGQQQGFNSCLAFHPYTGEYVYGQNGMAGLNPNGFNPNQPWQGQQPWGQQPWGQQPWQGQQPWGQQPWQGQQQPWGQQPWQGQQGPNYFR